MNLEGSEGAVRILLIGCVQSSSYFLCKLIGSGRIPVGVVTRSASKLNTDFVDLAPICEEAGIPWQYVNNVNDGESAAFIRRCQPDIIYCFGWSQLVKSAVLRIPPMGCVGFHPAALPNNRGRHPLIWALALGLPETASSFFMMDEAADTGALISQERIPIAYEDDAASLYDKVLRVAGEQVLAFTEAFERGEVTPVPQREAGNTWRKRGILDGQIDWRMSSRAIYNLVRALARPYPGAHFLKDGQMVKVWRVEETGAEVPANIECGKILAVRSPTEFDVKVYGSVLRIVECEPVSLKEGDYLL